MNRVEQQLEAIGKLVIVGIQAVIRTAIDRVQVKHKLVVQALLKVKQTPSKVERTRAVSGLHRNFVRAFRRDQKQLRHVCHVLKLLLP